ncbi:MAG: quinone-dependent dihydroorotate dehydrogenase [Holophagales bacterium]|jgi:dihydroorotate dehydrogenase|nr:quinone-dependent dihydroorotate dehydrogenase [Holophagales bacterium]
MIYVNQRHPLYKTFRPLLFALPPEQAHALAIAVGKIAQCVPGVCSLLIRALAGKPHATLARRVAGVDFPAPIGLAAGLDKGAELLPIWKALGFGFAEIGTVTPLPQPGNPKPRSFRIVDEELALNRMGFNSEGAAVVAKRLKRRPKGLVVGGNIGKNKITPEERALDDYRLAYRAIAPEVDYVALNVSSPNTPGLRRLQAPELLMPLLTGMLRARQEMGLEGQPIFLKLAPDLAPEDLDSIVDTALASGISGLIATNTTLDRGIVKSEANRAKVMAWGDGGLSGRALKPKAQAMQRRILQRLNGRLPLIACGGISTPQDAQESLTMGASLAQVYTALIFQGPGLVAGIHEYLRSQQP